MYIPERKVKENKIKERKKLSSDKEILKISKEKIKEEKDKIKKEYIDSNKLEKALLNISLSQINRFYSMLEDRKFSFGSNSIKEFIDKQIERKIGEGVSSEEITFYKFFKDNFLIEEYENDKDKNKILIEMIKRYMRYYVAQKKLSENNQEA